MGWVWSDRLTELRVPVNGDPACSWKADPISWWESTRLSLLSLSPHIRITTFLTTTASERKSSSTSEIAISLFYPPPFHPPPPSSSPSPLPPHCFARFVLAPVLSWLTVHRRGEMINYNTRATKPVPRPTVPNCGSVVGVNEIWFFAIIIIIS